tara:strand:+ start:164 stop:316 length:153 start_codon:yes stop_codon:yes gene_type:complete
MIEELMKAADAVLDEATEETLEPEKITLHKKWKLNKFTMDEAVYIEDKDQ